jgi:hypothetical protein
MIGRLVRKRKRLIKRKWEIFKEEDALITDELLERGGAGQVSWRDLFRRGKEGEGKCRGEIF